MAGKRVIEDTSAFRAMWHSDMQTREIAAHYGVRPPAVCRAAKRFGLTSRMRGGDWSPGSGAARDRGAQDDQQSEKCLSVPETPPHPFFTVNHDARILQTGGCWRALDALAGEWGQPVQRILARFHRLRAG